MVITSKNLQNDRIGRPPKSIKKLKKNYLAYITPKKRSLEKWSLEKGSRKNVPGKKSLEKRSPEKGPLEKKSHEKRSPEKWSQGN